jgi:hypothetical protein
MALVKDKPVEPKDVVKAVANMNKCTATYHQSFGAVQASRSDASDKNKRSFHLLIPYLQKSMELNKGSTAMTECDGQTRFIPGCSPSEIVLEGEPLYSIGQDWL